MARVARSVHERELKAYILVAPILQKTGKLSHIRVDWANFNIIRPDHRFDGGLDNLKMLVLRPRSAAKDPDFPARVILPDKHVASELSLPDDISSSKEGQIAKIIAAHALPSLRVIAVGEYQF